MTTARPDWKKWQQMVEAAIDDAVALSCDINPDGVSYGVNQALLDEFSRRHDIVRDHVRTGGLKAVSRGWGMNHRDCVRLVDFAAWAASKPREWHLPSEFPRPTPPAEPIAVEQKQTPQVLLNDGKAGSAAQSLVHKEPALHRAELVEPDKITLRWLIQHLPLKGWVTLIGIPVTAFLIGVSAGGTTVVSEFLGKDPKSKGALSGRTSVDTQVQDIAKAHNIRMASLSAKYLEEEAAATDSANPQSWKDSHAESAKRIANAMTEENRSFADQIRRLGGTDGTEKGR